MGIQPTFDAVVYNIDDASVRALTPGESDLLASFRARVICAYDLACGSGRQVSASRLYACWIPRLYNQEQPHSSWENRTPEEFAREMCGEKGCGEDVPANRDLGIPLGFPGIIIRAPFEIGWLC